jgi:hypothetical protein
MDLIELQRKESRKVWIFCLLFVGACALTMVEFMDADIDPEDVITQCIEVLKDRESYKEEDVLYCRKTLEDIIRKRTRIST